jgi:pilus assembly protein Flp/PilA
MGFGEDRSPGGSKEVGALPPERTHHMSDLLEVYWTWAKSNLRREEGQALVEYALILTLVAIACIVVLTALGGAVKDKLQLIVDAL